MIEEQIVDFFEVKAEVVGVYLFGSYVSGKQRVGSDLDIALLFDSRDRTIVSRLIEQYRSELTRLFRRDVHLVALNFSGEALNRQILKKGRCVVVRDPQKMARFRMTALSKIFDFEYHFNKMQSGLIRKVAGGSFHGRP
jgi:predicted nucleotidyltransferase